MSKPIINKISSFDATIGTAMTFSYSGSLPYRNRIIIYSAENMASIYDDTITSFSLSHDIPGGTLKNGTKYAIQCQCFDSDGNASTLSDKSYFWCVATPDFAFANIHEGETLSVASIYAELSYHQPDYEDIAEFKFYLYDENKNTLIESETFYDADSLGYTYRGFSNSTVYFIRAVGSTANGMNLDTGYLKVFVEYDNPDDYRFIYVNCNNNTGVVTYNTNFTVINPSDQSIQKYDNSFINLTDKTLVYDKDFLASGDFTMSIRGKEMFHTGTILKCSNDGYGFTLTSYIYDDGSLRYKLIVPNGICNYILYSTPLVFEQTDIVTIHIRRVNNIYELKCFTQESIDDNVYNMWFGDARPPYSEMERYDIWVQNGEASTTKVDKENVNVFYQDDEPTLLAYSKYDIWIGG
jgi:hypothetical protein